MSGAVAGRPLAHWAQACALAFVMWKTAVAAAAVAVAFVVASRADAGDDGGGWRGTCHRGRASHSPHTGRRQCMAVAAVVAAVVGSGGSKIEKRAEDCTAAAAGAFAAVVGAGVANEYGGDGWRSIARVLVVVAVDATREDDCDAAAVGVGAVVDW